MSSTDPFTHFDGAYVLGALSAQERDSFEIHLAGCAECQARVGEVQGVAGLLAAVPTEALEPIEDVPDTLLPGLLRRASAERRRRRLITTGLAGLAAACAIALAVAVWPSSGTSRPAPVAMSAVIPSPVTATARLTDRAWGTEIELACTYRGAAVPYGYGYQVVIVDKQGRAHELGTWTLVPGKTIHYRTGTSLPRDQITSVAIDGPADVPILRLTL